MPFPKSWFLYFSPGVFSQLINIFIYLSCNVYLKSRPLKLLLPNDDICELFLISLSVFLHQGSRDNMSIVILALAGAPQVSEEAIRREEELDARLEAIIKGIVSLPDTFDS